MGWVIDWDLVEVATCFVLIVAFLSLVVVRRGK